MCLYLLVAYGIGPPLMIKLPGLKLLDGFIHGNFPHFHPLLQGYELPLSRRLHPSVGVMSGRGPHVRYRPYWTYGRGCHSNNTERVSKTMIRDAWFRIPSLEKCTHKMLLIVSDWKFSCTNVFCCAAAETIIARVKLQIQRGTCIRD